MDKKGASSAKILWSLRKDTHLLDEFCYEADEDAQGCGFFLWYDSKIQQDMHNLTTMVGNLTLQLRRVQDEKKELESTLERVHRLLR
ncbi:hypothetical protein LINPERPRIM_LOCUS41666 [Linum perenne]